MSTPVSFDKVFTYFDVQGRAEATESALTDLRNKVTIAVSDFHASVGKLLNGSNPFPENSIGTQYKKIIDLIETYKATEFKLLDAAKDPFKSTFLTTQVKSKGNLLVALVTDFVAHIQMNSFLKIIKAEQRKIKEERAAAEKEAEFSWFRKYMR